MKLLLCAMLANSMVLAESVVEITVCPENYPAPKDQCVTLHQLVTKPDLIKSHTIITFVTATFTLEPNSVIFIADVSNITITTSTTNQVSIACSGDNSGWLFQNVSGLTLKNINFINCGAVWNFSSSFNTTCVLGLEKCADVLMDNLTFIHARSYGVFASNVYGSLTLTNTLFRYSGTGLGLRYDEKSPDKFSLTHGQPEATMSNCEFSENHYSASAALVIDATLYASPLPLKLHIVDVLVTNNTKTSDISDVSFLSLSPISTHIILENYRRVSNTIIGDVYSNILGSSDFFYVYDSDSDDNGTNIIEIMNCTFMDNVYDTGGSVDSFNIDLNLYSVLFFYTSYANKPHKVSVVNSKINNNIGKYGAALYYESSTDLQLTNLQIVNCTFANQAVFSSDYYKKGTVFLKRVSNVTVHNSNFIGNSGTGLLLENSYATFTGTTIIRGNKAFNGGGIVLYEKSKILLSETASLNLGNNIAENVGGGLYASIQHEDLVSSEKLCYISFSDNASVLFNNNSASRAGNDIYGGNLYTCMIGLSPGWKALGDILHSSGNNTIELTSDPTHVCDCSEESIEDCMKIAPTIKTVWTYPGRQFNLSLLAVGLVVNGTALSGVSTAIYATLLDKNTGTIPSSLRVQSSKRTCTSITYRIDTCSDHEVMVLAVNDDGSKMEEYLNSLWLNTLRWNDHIDKLLLHNLLIPAYVEVYFHQCPTGFNLSSHGVCVCSDEIEPFVDGCSIDTLQLQTKPLHWMGLFNTSKQDTSVYLTHQHCPFNYCKAGTFTFSLDEPDAQCSHHRTGILCGACEPGYSLVLGSTECRKCSNIYFSLLSIFVVAGVGMIAFLFLTDMTVATGTISGLLFYANILTDNKATLFSSQASDGFLSTFIAWLSLDLGVTTCFYDGLDGYVYTWLQLAFPIYVWLLAYFIILAARHVTFVSKLCGSNIVSVLATLFLLSYTKLLQTIITGLSFTVVEASNGEHLFVWLKDGNVPYLQGKHIPLFIVSVVFLLVLLTYTLAIVLGPWLQRKTHLRAFKWVVTLKPLLDAYYGPLNDQYRYWTGLLLLSRIILGLVSAVNALGDESINLLAIVIVSSLLLLRSSAAYKYWALSLLDSFFLLNLIVFSSVSLLNKLSSVDSQYAAVCVSVGATFAVFALILLYHCFVRMKKACIGRLKASLQVDISDSRDSGNELLDTMDAKSD